MKLMNITDRPERFASVYVQSVGFGIVADHIPSSLGVSGIFRGA